MAGGLMQLVSYGTQDIYLTGNPQITFFKIVYRRHTNFSIETIDHSFINTPNFGSRVSVIFPRNADLINRMYVKITLSTVDPTGNKFAWVRRIGHAILDLVEFELGGTIMDRLYGTWLDIWYELSRTGDHERGYAHMVGDVPELTSYNTDTKPEYVLFVPLQFWFNRHIGLSIPLVALQYHDARIHVTFTEKQKLYIKDCNFDDTNISIVDASLLTNYVYLDSEERRRFAQVGHEYLIERTQFNGLEQVLININRYQLDYNHPTQEIIWAMKNGNYITGEAFMFYTDKDDWNEIDDCDPATLTPLQEASCKIIEESISFNFDPTAQVGGTWTEVPGLTTATVGTINITNTATMSTYVNPESLIYMTDTLTYGITDKINVDVTVNTDGTITCSNIVTTLTVRDLSVPVSLLTDTRYQACDPQVYQFTNYGLLIDGSGNPTEFALIQLNGHDRFDRREGLYFNYVQPYQHHSNTPRDGINVYSFSLFPEEHQPSGTANLSRIDDTRLNICLSDQTTSPTLPDLNFLKTSNELWVFGRSYNILRVMSGLAALAYSAAGT